MIQSHQTFLKNALVLSDIVIISLLFPLASGMHNRVGIAIQHGFMKYILEEIDWDVVSYSGNLIFIIPAWLFCLSLFQSYDSLRARLTSEAISGIIHGTITFTFLFTLYLVVVGFSPYGYSIVLVYPTLCLLVLGISRIVILSIFRLSRRLGYNQRNIVIVGTGPRALDHVKKVEGNLDWGLHLLGYVLLEGAEPYCEGMKRYDCLGAMRDINSILEGAPVDEMFFIVPRSWLDKIEEAVMICEDLGVTVHVAVDLFSQKMRKSDISNFYGLPVLTFNSLPTNISALAIKRAIDLFISTLGLLIFLPFGLLIAVAMKLDSKGPILFSQERCGMNGRRFQMFKFRSMYEGAELDREKLEEKNEQDGPVFKMKEDPRVTRLGGLLRKTSLDEIPQLWNVFLGEMSLVGPRPPLPEEVSQYEVWQRRRLSMRPGITCLWQISGRNNLGFDKWMELDLHYIDHWSLALDLHILIRTIPAVLTGRGSH